MNPRMQWQGRQLADALGGLGDMQSDAMTAGSHTIPFTLRRSLRRTLGITVFPDGSVLVSAPIEADGAAIRARVRRRSAWILRTRREFENYRPRTPPRRYVSGETHRFLGKQLRLTISAEGRRGVQVNGPRLLVTGYHPDDPDAVAGTLRRWYHRQAKTTFAARMTACLPLFASEELQAPTLSVRRLTRRWGSMSAHGHHLTLNARLVEAAPRLIDYVIVHELCHAVHPHHGAAFFQLLQRRMPDWDRRKARLERWMV